MCCYFSLQDISEANFMLHELRCAKHVALCEQCGEAVAREELQQHYEEEHAPVACQHCGDKFPREQIDSHTVSWSMKPLRVGGVSWC